MTIGTLSAAFLLGAFGIQVDLNYGNWSSIPQLIFQAQFTGARVVRVGTPNPQDSGLVNYEQLAAAGLNFDFVVNPAFSPADNAKWVADFVARHPQSVAMVEGPNEPNNFAVQYQGKSSIDAAIAWQHDFYAAMKANSAIRSIPVYGMISWPNIASDSDVNNLHVYANNGEMLPATIQAARTAQEAVDPGKPFGITEMGQFTGPSLGKPGEGVGVDEATQAKILLVAYIGAMGMGTRNVGLYALRDWSGSDGGSHFGLFHADNTPKPAATALHNLTTILADNAGIGSSFTPGILGYSLSSLSTSGHSLLLQKAPEIFDLALWTEPDVWNATTRQPITVAAQPVTVRLGNVYRSVTIFDPLKSATPITTLKNVSQVQIDVTDHPLIVELAGQGASVLVPEGLNTVVGNGTDELVLKVSEDGRQGDARYTVSVDGEQVGGTLTAKASHTLGHDDTVTLLGSWGSGMHSVKMNFLNGASADTARNLYVDAILYRDADALLTGAVLKSGGAVTFPIGESQPGDRILGTGPDTLVVKISQDAWMGDAQYTISVDGTPIGGTLTAHASHKLGQENTVMLRGSWGARSHIVTVNFVNDAWGGSADADRNLYVRGMFYNGRAITGAAGNLLAGGPRDFNIPASSPAIQTIGSGRDTLVLRVSQDAWQGNAQYSVSIDGHRIGDIVTAAALHSTGQKDVITLRGNWGKGSHVVTVNFLNDAWDTATGGDRNLYVQGMSYNGKAVVDGSADLLSSGPRDFNVPASAPTIQTVGSGPDTLVLKLSQDAWQGNAQYTVSVDGHQIGDIFTAAALHATSQMDVITLRGNWGSGPHLVTVNFLNDAWDTTTGGDRNLYVLGMSYNGKAIADTTADLLSSGARDFSIPAGPSALTPGGPVAIGSKQ